MKKEEGLAMTSGISGWLGVTEPAMFGVNLPLKYPFLAAIFTTAFVGGLFGRVRGGGKRRQKIWSAKGTSGAS